MLRSEIQDKEIFITNTVIDIFKYQLQTSVDEKGGILLGPVSKKEHQVLVCRASLTGGSDTSKRAFFRRDKRTAQQIIQYEFYNSGGKNTYLGEWHTHPSNSATPSSQDIRMIKRQFTTNEMNVDFILLFIVAQTELFVGIFNGQKWDSQVFDDL